MESQLQYQNPPKGVIFLGKKELEPYSEPKTCGTYRAGKGTSRICAGREFEVQPGDNTSPDGALRVRQSSLHRRDGGRSNPVAKCVDGNDLSESERRREHPNARHKIGFVFSAFQYAPNPCGKGVNIANSPQFIHGDVRRPPPFDCSLPR